MKRGDIVEFEGIIYKVIKVDRKKVKLQNVSPGYGLIFRLETTIDKLEEYEQRRN